MALPPGNFIVDVVAAREPAILRNAKVVSLERAETTTLRDGLMTTVDFPVTALMSIIGILEDGGTCEIASVGTDAFVEIDAALRTTTAKRTSLCSFGGDVVRMPLPDFQAALVSSALFADLVYHAVRARVFVTEQLEMCNAKHTVGERLARWFLLASLRLNRNEFSVTHDFLSSIMGTRRASVSAATAALEARGGIYHARKLVMIKDRTRLESDACECYAACADAITACMTSSTET